jgi:hypothetical protein
MPSLGHAKACVLAYWIWTEDDSMLSDTEIQQVDSYKVGPLDVQVNKARVIFPVKVEELLKSIGPGVLVALSTAKSGPVRFSR